MAPSRPLNTDTPESRLCAERKDLTDRIRDQLHRSEDPQLLSLANHLSEVDDWAAADLLADTDIAILGWEISRLRDIDVALQRVRAGTYGVCTYCGQAIDPARLNAQPAARLCLSCKQEFEKRRGIVKHLAI